MTRSRQAQRVAPARSPLRASPLFCRWRWRDMPALPLRDAADTPSLFRRRRCFYYAAVVRFDFRQYVFSADGDADTPGRHFLRYHYDAYAVTTPQPSRRAQQLFSAPDELENFPAFSRVSFISERYAADAIALRRRARIARLTLPPPRSERQLSRFGCRILRFRRQRQPPAGSRRMAIFWLPLSVE
jgi:hypothetical protein